MSAGGSARRYPGARSFADSTLDRLLFFGRDQESSILLDTIMAESLVVLYARSGVGKSSLLNTAISEGLRNQGCAPLIARVNLLAAGPVASVLDGVQKSAQAQGLEHSSVAESSLWRYFTEAEFWRDDRLLLPVLILDQFEELFTLYDAEMRGSFVAHLADLVRDRSPRSAGENTQADGPGGSMRPRIKVVISLREDFLGHLEDLSGPIPQILQARFRLEPLTREQAADAIRRPATLVDAGLGTPREPFCAYGGSS